MKDHGGMIRGFTHFGGSWYGRNVHPTEDRISIGFYTVDGNGGTTGEFSVQWRELSRKAVPRLECFSDAWDALTHFQDFLSELAKLDDSDPTPEQVCALLRELGIRELTKKIRQE